MVKLNRRQSVVGIATVLAASAAGYLICKTFPHLLERTAKKGEHTTVETTEEAQEEVKSLVEEASEA